MQEKGHFGKLCKSTSIAVPDASNNNDYFLVIMHNSTLSTSSDSPFHNLPESNNFINTGSTVSIKLKFHQMML